MISIAIAGTGMIVKEILPVLSELEQINITALCGTKRSETTIMELCNNFSIAYEYTDYELMIKDIADRKIRVDAVYIATPNNLHYDMAMAAINKGINVFLEKPFVSSYSDAVRLIENARKKKVFLLEAISNQYLPIYKALRNALPKVGQIKYVECNFSQYSSKFDRFAAGEYFRVFDLECDGGVLMDLNVYNIHMVAGLFGEPLKVNYLPNMMRNVDTSGVLTLSYPDFTSCCVAAKDCQGPSRTLIQGTKGYLLIEAPANSLDSTLVFYSTQDKTFEDIFVPESGHRMAYEFRELDKIISSGAYDECIRRQEETLCVCRILSDAHSTLRTLQFS